MKLKNVDFHDNQNGIFSTGGEEEPANRQQYSVCSGESMDLSDEAAMKARVTTEMNSSGECPKPCLSESDLAVRLYDIDFNGHVSNIVYIRWLEDIRTVAFERIMPLKSCLDLGQTPVLIRTDIRYRRPVKMFDQPKGRIWVTGYTKTSFTLEAEIRVNGECCADATQKLCFVYLKTGKLTRLPEEIIQTFEKELIATPAR
jgi:acyl-CoA thioester hydrolase